MRAGRLLVLLLLPVLAFAQDFQISGELRTLTTVDSYGASSVISMVGDETAVTEARIAARIMVHSKYDNGVSFTAHYENSFSKGEYLSALEALHGRTAYPDLLARRSPSDDTQLFSLTEEYVDENGEQAYHRLDRLYAEYSRGDYNTRFGRQAVTWGHGKIFNPEDILNPFSPTDVFRDWKNGTDMLSFQTYTKMFSDVQTAIVPRRDAETREIRYDKSTAAAKLTKRGDSGDAEVLFGVHYDEAFIGAGTAADVGDAAVRADAMVFDCSGGPCISAVANADYSWVAFDRNMYGYAEFYYDSLGEDSIYNVMGNRELYERIQRGDIYLRDRYYGAAGLQYEAHPLVNLYASIIYNMGDSSYIVQPRAVYDIRDNLRITAGLDIPSGNPGTEFGGFEDSLSRRMISPAKRIYGEVTLYF